jgi:hypothetical protein
MKTKNFDFVFPLVSLLIAILSLVIGVDTLQRVSQTVKIPQIEKLTTEVRIAPVLAEGLCGFRPGYPTEGFKIPSGTEVEGPAVLEPLSEDDDYIIAIYPRVSHSSEVEMKAWLYKGDEGCLEAQIVHFPQSEVIRIKPEEYDIFLPLIMNTVEKDLNCGFRDNGKGVAIQEDQTVEGPAVLIPLEDDSYLIAIYPGAEYTTEMVMQGWLYYGDSDCLESQFESFPGRQITKITP